MVMVTSQAFLLFPFVFVLTASRHTLCSGVRALPFAALSPTGWSYSTDYHQHQHRFCLLLLLLCNREESVKCCTDWLGGGGGGGRCQWEGELMMIWCYKLWWINEWDRFMMLTNSTQHEDGETDSSVWGIFVWKVFLRFVVSFAVFLLFLLCLPKMRESQKHLFLKLICVLANFGHHHQQQQQQQEQILSRILTL